MIWLLYVALPIGPIHLMDLQNYHGSIPHEQVQIPWTPANDGENIIELPSWKYGSIFLWVTVTEEYTTKRSQMGCSSWFVGASLPRH